MKVELGRLAIARSGDKGDAANVGVIALSEAAWPVLRRELTVERVREHFAGVCRGPVVRYELPNLGALNFLLHESLGGGGTVSLMLDAQGKTFGAAILSLEVEAPAEVVEACDRVRAGAAPGRTGGTTDGGDAA
ncbi:MAG: hypothetical protein RRA92_02185 [Gemmatimonadota bacterium]|nr:hypothetical protein [Gemmatimonadota bacterium]